MQFESLNLAHCSNPRDAQRIRDAIAGAEDEVSQGHFLHRAMNSKVFRRLTVFLSQSVLISYGQLVAR